MMMIGMDGAGVRAGSDMLAAAVALAGRVGACLTEMQAAARVGARAKSDGSPVTRADAAAHDILDAGLPRIGAYPVVSEESEPADQTERLRARTVWIVDPLDGTRDYLRGSPEFTVNIALVEDGVPILGVMAAPALGLTYFAERGSGAFRSTNGRAPERISCRTKRVPDDRIVVSGSDAALSWEHVPSLAGARVEAVSSCIKLGFVADGSALAYPRLTPSSEWDIAAGHAIVLEAGGRVVGIDGRDLVYNKPDPLNTAFVATGSAEIAAAFAAILTPAP